MKKYILLFTMFSIFGQFVNAQIFHKMETYTKGDTLRGTLGPERNWFDVTHYNLNLTLNVEDKTISGYNEISFNVDKPNSVMQLDLFENMNVDSIIINGKSLDFERTFNAVMIQVPKLEKGSNEKVKFYYSGKPIIAVNPPWDGGFVWSKDDNGKDWIGVACQGMGASAWYPNKDHQSDEPDSVLVSVAVPKDLMFVGNGNLRGMKAEGDLVRYDWAVTYPINNYNVTLNVADYVKIDDYYVGQRGDTLDIDYFVLINNKEKAEKHFKRDVGPMLKCFEEHLGEYPFWDDGFALVETPYLGMEHQSAIAYGNKYKDGYAGNLNFTDGLKFDYIVIHEAGHEWWGNSVTSKDIADMWIHESFCTYSESVFVECIHDYETAQSYVNNSKQFIRNQEPIIGVYGVNKRGSGDMYQKGSLFLNTLRHYVDNDKLWWRMLKDLVEKYKYQTLTANEIFTFYNKESGKNLDKIFEQYLEYPKLPELEYVLEKNGKKHTDFSFRWVADVEGFDLPMIYQDKKGDWKRVNPTSNWQTITVKKVKPNNFKLGEDQFYFRPVKLNEKIK